MKRACFAVLPLAGGALVASAAEPAGAPATQPYKGWVHVHYAAGNGMPAHVSHYNTLTGASWSEKPTSGQTILHFENPVVHEVVEYYPSTGQVRIGEMEPYDDSLFRYNWAFRQCTTYEDVLERYRALLGTIEPEKVVRKKDGELEYIDFGDLTHVKKTKEQSQDLEGLPLIIWVDPQSHLILQDLMGAKRRTFTYGGPDVASIYDIGAPRTATVFDNRPAPQALALLDRLQHRATAPFPDGTYVFVDESDDETDLDISEKNGNHWESREYSVPHNPGAKSDLPADWTGAGSDLFFKFMATINSTREVTSDGHTTQDYDHDPRANKPTKDTYTGAMAKWVLAGLSPEHKLYTLPRNLSPYGVLRHLDLISDDSHPGLLDLRVQVFDLSSNKVSAACEFWIDPAHNDRPVQFISTLFDTSSPRAVGNSTALKESARGTTDYTQYASLPPPDGRVYPTLWTDTTYQIKPDGQLGKTSTTTTHTFHFFPDRTLPPLKIATPPATPGNHP